MNRSLTKTATPGIYRRGGRYVVVLRDRDGRQFKKSTRTLAHARELKATVSADLARGELQSIRRVTFAEYASEWFDTYGGRTSKGIRSGTLDDYRASIEREALPFFGHRALADIQLRDIKHFAQRVAERGVTRNTVRLAVAPVRALLATAVEDGLLRTNPASGFRNVYGAASTKPLCKALSDDELALVIAEVPVRWRPVIRFLAETGLRIGEVAGLVADDIDLDARRVYVRRRVYRGTVDKPKSAYGIRTVPLSQSMVAALADIMELNEEFGYDIVFPSSIGEHIDSRSLNSIFKAAAVRAGVPWASLHTLRHTCASRLFRAGWNAKQVQMVLGHHSPAFTLATYVHLMPDDLPTDMVPVEAPGA